MSTNSDGRATTKKNPVAAGRPTSTKATYSKNAGKRLAEANAKLTGINAKIRAAVASGKLEASEQLKLAQKAVETNQKAAEAHLSRLRKSGEDKWEDFKDDVEDAWEHLNRSIKKLVDKYSDGSKN